jgi:general secretion pathway protein D
MRFIAFFWLVFASVIPSLNAQTIAEKKAALSESKGDLDQDTEKFLLEVNRELLDTHEELRQQYQIARKMYEDLCDAEEFENLLVRIKELKKTILTLEEGWRTTASQSTNVEPYALWHQPETTLEQLVVDYGSQDYVYLIPPEIGQIKLSLGSNLPIPRSAWNDMLESILTQNGVGVRQLNPFLRELYLLKNDNSGIELITSERADLDPLPPRTRVAFVLTPEPSDVRRTFYFIDNFINHQSSTVQLVGRDILLIAEASEILDLLKLADFVCTTRGDIEYRALPLGKIAPDEMIKILGAIFNPSEEKKRGKDDKGDPIQDNNGLRVIKLGGSVKGIFVAGTREEVRRAVEVVKEVEGQIGGSRQKVIHWYTAKYSDPNELADVLYKVYKLMIQTGTGMEKRFQNPSDLAEFAAEVARENVVDEARAQEAEYIAARQIANDTLPPQLYPTDSYFEGGFPIAPAPIRAPDPNAPRRISNRTNFIVDEKTAAIVMVVEADILTSLKDLIKRLDVPKKMVEIEVLLLEKRDRRRTDFGLNLLRLGTCASQKNRSCALFTDLDNDFTSQLLPGIFDFILSRKADHGIPAFDLVYRFLLSQEDISINSNPTVVTVNQTPAFISIQEEQSINTGVFQVETAKGVTLEDAFKRAQYGVTIKITPTIHLREDSDVEPYDSVTLVSDVIFDTVQSNVDDRPVVIRRNIKNEARVADGETIILGGLRRKDLRDTKDGIPFLGEIPGIGKLFSQTTLDDRTSEMYIFITPKIIRDPACELEWIRQEELERRAGDIPEFAICLAEAQEADKNRCFKQWMRILFGRDEDRLYTPGWHEEDTCGKASQVYDGR